MRLLTPAILSTVIACIAYARVAQHPDLRLRSGVGGTCQVGEPGAVYVEAHLPVITNTGTPPVVQTTMKKFPASKATACISKENIIKEMTGSASGSVVAIGPDSGGHCLVYHSYDCKDNTGMPLIAPPGITLRFPK